MSWDISLLNVFIYSFLCIYNLSLLPFTSFCIAPFSIISNLVFFWFCLHFSFDIVSPYLVKLSFPLISFLFSPMWFYPPHSFVLLCSVSPYLFQSVFTSIQIFIFSFSLTNLFGKEQNTYFKMYFLPLS